MAKEIVFESLVNFIETLKREQLQRLIFTMIDEKRSSHDITRDEVLVHHVKKAEILAYKESTIFKFIAFDSLCDRAEVELTEAGFELNKRDRNIV